MIIASVSLATLRVFIFTYTGLDIAVIVAFLFLIIAEFQTGLKVSIKVKGEKFKSRKFGRMILKIGTYIAIVVVLHTFSKGMEVPNVLGFDINPFLWLYYMVFTAIVFQLFISWMENLGCLGYKETQSIAGFVLRKFNKWFEFDGKKDNGDN
ncbi:MAG: phage holin family protein [Sphingobacteriales bacterium]|nr:phage holin family protein [Sphingobacteriales bacterium]